MKNLLMQIVEATRDPSVFETVQKVIGHPVVRRAGAHLFEKGTKIIEEYMQPTSKEKIEVVLPRTRAMHDAKLKQHEGVRSEALAAPVSFGARVTLGDVVYKHHANGNLTGTCTELVCDLVLNGTEPFQNVAIVGIQPGLTAAFPKLSAAATRWQEYRIKKLSYHLATEAATSNTGAIYMGVMTDVNQGAPTNKREIMALAGATRSPLWSDCRVVLDKAQRGGWKKVRFGPINNDYGPAIVPSGDYNGREPYFNVDYNNYDAGVLVVARSAVGAICTFELYVTYEVEFRNPSLRSALVPSAVLSSPGTGGSLLNGAAFGAILPSNTRNGTIYIEPSAGGDLTQIVVGNLTQGRSYQYTWYMQGAAAAGSQLIVVSGGSSYVYSALADATQRMEVGGLTADSPTMLIKATTAMTGLNFSQLVISELPPNPWI